MAYMLCQSDCLYKAAGRESNTTTFRLGLVLRKNGSTRRQNHQSGSVDSVFPDPRKKSKQ